VAASTMAETASVTATWPIKTESEHSLHQAKKNAAQSTVLVVTRTRPGGAGLGYFDRGMREEIHQRAHQTAERLEREGLNPVDQLVGAFGPAIGQRKVLMRGRLGESVAPERSQGVSGPG